MSYQTTRGQKVRLIRTSWIVVAVLSLSFTLSCKQPGSPQSADPVVPEWAVGWWIAAEPDPGNFIALVLGPNGNWFITYDVHDDGDDNYIFDSWTGPECNIAGDESSGIITLHDGNGGTLPWTYSIQSTDIMEASGTDFSGNPMSVTLYRYDEYVPADKMKTAPPSWVSATQGTHTSQISIFWNNQPYAQLYNVYRSATVSGTYELIGTADETSGSFDNTINNPAGYPIEPEENYYYKVSIVTADNIEGPMSEAVNGWTDELTPPKNIEVSQGTYTDRIRLTWDENVDAEQYEIYICLTQYGTYLEQGITTAQYYSLGGGTPGYDYWFKVRSIDENGLTSNFSSSYSGWEGLDPPTGVTAEPYAEGQVQITWSDESDDESGFRIYRTPIFISGTPTYVFVASVSADQESCIVSGLDNYEGYMYYVASSYGSRRSNYSVGEVGYAITPPVLNSPFTFTDSSGHDWDRYEIDFEWGSPIINGADQFIVEWKWNIGDDWSAMDPISRPGDYKDIASFLNPYAVRVKAKQFMYGESPFSNVQ